MARNALIQLRRDTAANWTSVNPTLAAGEQGFETDTGRYKIGNGTTPWNALGVNLTVDSLTAGNQVEGDVLISYNQAEIGTDLSVGNDLEVANNATISGTSNIIGGVFLGDGIVDASVGTLSSLAVTDDITCGDISLPRGVMAYDIVTTSDTTISTTEEVQITGSSFTAVAGRLYKITYYEGTTYLGTTGSNYLKLRIRQTNVSGTQLAFSTPYVLSVFSGGVIVSALTTFTSGTVNVVATAQANAGTTNQCVRSATQPAYLLVEDIGAVINNDN